MKINEGEIHINPPSDAYARMANGAQRLFIIISIAMKCETSNIMF